MTRRGLRGSNVKIVSARSAQEALGCVEIRRARAVLTDMNLPGENGVWLLTQLATSHPDIHRILTSSIELAGLEEHMESGVVQNFVLKTVTAEQLDHMLEGSAAA
ncbi:MAG: response regulator [Polyangiaceae bacterium]|nr:response regulator [Polyangiaceae bacterium]